MKAEIGSMGKEGNMKSEKIPGGQSSKKEGSALVLTMCIAGTVMVATVSVMSLANYEIGSITRAREDNVAKSIAEAGANAAYAQIKANFANKDNASLFPATSFNGGTYDATVTSVGSNACVISCTGVSGVTTSTVIMDLVNFSAGSSGSSGGGSGAPDPTSPWGQSVFVNGTISHNGSGVATGNVRGNQTLTCNGTMTWGTATNTCDVRCTGKFSANGTITILGSVTAPTISVNGTDHITTKVVAAVPALAFPVLDLTPYNTIAVANNQVYGSTSYNGTTTIGSIPGGVRWYNGTLSFNGASTWSGCLIATGAVSFNGAVSHTKVNNLPAVVSRDSTISFNGSHTIHGLVYAAGNVTWNGSGTLTGALLVGGNLTFNGSYGNIYYDYSMPSASSGSGSGSGSSGSSGVVGVTAWQK